MAEPHETAVFSGGDNDIDLAGHRVDELTLPEAASLFTVPVATLRRLISAARLPARRVSRICGRDWPVPTSALEQAMYARRTIDFTEDQSEVRRLADALRAERARAAHLDGELGYALLAIGRLSGRLREAGIDPDDMFGAELHDSDGSCNGA